jgi:hypothetical protein
MNTPDYYQTITTPFGLSIRIGRGTIFRTDKGLFIITNVLLNEAGGIASVSYTPITEAAMPYDTLAAAVKDGMVRL